MEIFQRLDLRYKISHDSRRGSLIKDLLPFKESTKVKGLHVILKMKKGSGPYVEKSTCAKRSRKHEGKCPIDMGNCYGCGKSGHMKRDFPIMKDQGREIYHAQARDPNPDAPKKNHFYAL